MRDIDVVMISSDSESYVTTQTNSDGQYFFRLLPPGEYVIGLNFPKRRGWINGSGSGAGLKLPPASLFYPGVKDRSAANAIRLATDKTVDNVDFILPAK